MGLRSKSQIGVSNPIQTKPKIKIEDVEIIPEAESMVIKVKFDFSDNVYELVYPLKISEETLVKSLKQDYENLSPNTKKWTKEELKGVEIWEWQ